MLKQDTLADLILTVILNGARAPSTCGQTEHSYKHGSLSKDVLSL